MSTTPKSLEPNWQFPFCLTISIAPARLKEGREGRILICRHRTRPLRFRRTLSSSSRLNVLPLDKLFAANISIDAKTEQKMARCFLTPDNKILALKLSAHHIVKYD